MAQMPRTKAPPKKLVWRISASAPQGEWVDPTQIAAPIPKLAEPEVSTGSWVTSSFDLLNGTDIVEVPDAMSPDLFNELFEEPAPEPKAKRK
jgi:hypothetical protein